MAKSRPQSGLIYVAKESFSIQHPHSAHSVGVVEGDTVREGHWLLEGREHLFKLQTPRYEVEQATNAPGEKRGA